jgi:F0F1-type ATP synthase membrane subunit b/b'
VRFPLLIVVAIAMAVALWLLMRFVLNPLDAKPGA